MNSVFAGIAVRERRVSVAPEKTMMVLGIQLWFISDGSGERQRPRGSKVAVVRVRVLIRTYLDLRKRHALKVEGYNTRAVKD